MQAKVKTLPWWMVVITGLLIIAAGIFLLVSPVDGLNLLTFILGAGVLVFGLYNIYRAFRYKDENRLSILFLVHGLLDLVLFLLIVVIQNSPAQLGVILSCGFIIFGIFDIIHARSDGESGPRTRIGFFLLLIGVVLILLPFLIGIDHVLFLGIVSILIGVVRTAQGIIRKLKLDNNPSGGRGLM